MKNEYAFSVPRKNPYTHRERKQITINLDAAALDYFRAMSEKSGIPYQTLINLYLVDCAEQNRTLHMEWTA